MRFLLAGFLLVADLIVPTAAADGRVRAAVDTDGTIWVGQRVAFHVDLLSPTIFSGSPRFEVPEVPGLVLMKVEDRPTISSESIDGETWSVQRHEFAAFAQRAGMITIPPIEVTFGVPPEFGQPPEEQRGRTSELQFQTELPPGVDRLQSVISSTSFTAEEQWTPALEDRSISAQTGDAWTRKIVLKSSDLPAMVFPTIPPMEVEGLSAYPDRPILKDTTNRGEFVGQRTDSVTYVCATPGRVTLPALVIRWWDIENEQLQSIEFPAVTFDIAASTPPEGEASVTADSTVSPGSLIIAFVVAVALLVLGVRYGAAGRAWVGQQWSRIQASEPARYRRLCAAAARKEAPATLRALMAWLDGPDGPSCESIAQLAAERGVAALESEANKLQRAVLTGSGNWDSDALLAAVRAVRTPDAAGRGTATALPPLNP